MKNFKGLRNVLTLVLCFGMLAGNTAGVEAAPRNVKMSSSTFDMDYYYNTYADLQTALGYNYTALYNHYLEHGLKEGRSGSAEFNCVVYRNNYSDLRAAFQNDYVSYCLHYEQYGKAEGRNAIEQFTTGTSTVDNAAGTNGNVTDTAASNDVLGSYTTYYDATIQRATNVEVAASRINGVVIEPGQEFSFTHTILPRTAENGYVPAPVISNGKYVIGYGGGICQVSSTLYAAMLNASLPATERHPHSLVVSYIPQGMDATISTTVKDLKFKNIFDYDIQITAAADSETGTLTVSIVKL